MSTAILSPCGTYRYSLTREGLLEDIQLIAIARASMLRVLFLLLNPSKADATLNDPTVVRGMGFARAWGFRIMEYVNLFAYRATFPTDLVAAQAAGVDVVGPDNDRHILEAASRAQLIICAWGAAPFAVDRARAVRHLLRNYQLYHLGLTKNQQPKHPLYLRGDIKPALWREAA